MRIVALALGLLAVSGGFAAAQQTPEAPAAWRVECAGDGKILECRAVQQISSRDARLVATVSVRQPPDNKAPLMMVQLPLGLNLPEPVQIRVDGGTPEKHPLQTCNAAGCYIGMVMSETLFNAMRGGTDLKVVFQDASKKAIELSFPLLGFGLAYDKAK